MSSINSVIAELSSTFGFHTADTFPRKTEHGTSPAVISNIFNVIGYCPGAGVALGALRIYGAIKVDAPTSIKIANVIRGILEILGLGLLYFTPDVIATIIRFAPCSNCQQEGNE
jgi:hypothetical protein